MRMNARNLASKVVCATAIVTPDYLLVGLIILSIIYRRSIAKAQWRTVALRGGVALAAILISAFFFSWQHPLVSLGLAVLVFIFSHNLLPSVLRIQQSSLSAEQRSLAITVGFLALLVISGMEFLVIRELRVSGPYPHPNLLGHSCVLLAILLLPRMTHPHALIAGVAAIGVIAMTGSRVALVLTVVIMALYGAYRMRKTIGSVASIRSAAVRYLIVAVLAFSVLALLLGSAGRWGFVSYLREATREPGLNLLSRSEDLLHSSWSRNGVDIEQKSPSVFEITKTALPSWTRPQQQVTIFPGETYTVSLEFLAKDGVAPGIIAVGLGATESIAVAGVMDNATWIPSMSGVGTLIKAASRQLLDGWVQAYVSFEYNGSSRTTLSIGPAPDISEQVGGQAYFRKLQVVKGAELLSYSQGVSFETSPSGWASIQARNSYWAAAWHGFMEKPLAGWGFGAFAAYYRNLWEVLPLADDHPVHAHNLILEVLFSFGLIGFAILSGTIYFATSAAIHARSYIAIVAISAAIIMNMFDYTLAFGGVLYPLAGYLGYLHALRKG